MARKPNRPGQSGSVYVIAAPNGLVKIGMTKNSVRDRFMAISGQCPVPLKLVYERPLRSHLAVIEAEAHERLARVRSHGEWFACSVSDAVLHIEAAAGEYEMAKDVN